MERNTTTIILEDYLEAFTKALEVGEESGFVENFNPKENLAELHTRKF